VLVAVGGTSVAVAVGGTVVLVGVAVGGTAVLVAVAVGGTAVFVAVGGTAVFVAVAVGGIAVLVAVTLVKVTGSEKTVGRFRSNQTTNRRTVPGLVSVRTTSVQSAAPVLPGRTL
jgi:hypothetical protein